MEIKFELNQGLFLKDPQESELGKNIIREGINLIDAIGFEAFNFKKLALKIGSTERSIYRYFENKHLFLLFLTAWYWKWVAYLINTNIKNIQSPEDKLRIAIENLVKARSEKPISKYVDLHILHQLVIKEGGKAYHIIEVDHENKAGLFFSYKALVKLVADIILEINPSFKYSASLSSNLFEMANNQIYFSEHLPRLSSIKCGKNLNKDLIEMLNNFALKILS